MEHAVIFGQYFIMTNPSQPSYASILIGGCAMDHTSIRNGKLLPQCKPILALSLEQAGTQPLIYGCKDTSPELRYSTPDDPILIFYGHVNTGFIKIQEMRFD